MKYPYICKSEDGDVVFLISGKDLGIVLEDPKPIFVNETKERFGNTYVEDGSGKLLRGIKNITHEYLQNKKVKVESQEHLEFLYKLSVAAGYDGGYTDITFTDNYPWFAIVDDEPNEINEVLSVFHELEQITIPLPPKADKQESSEWPKVGSIVTWGNKSVKGEIKAVSDDLAWIKNEYGNYCSEYIKSLVKPKKPEEELRELLNELWNENAGDFDDFVDIAIHHVIKKPQ